MKYRQRRRRMQRNQQLYASNQPKSSTCCARLNARTRANIVVVLVRVPVVMPALVLQPVLLGTSTITNVCATISASSTSNYTSATVASYSNTRRYLLQSSVHQTQFEVVKSMRHASSHQ